MTTGLHDRQCHHCVCVCVFLKRSIADLSTDKCKIKSLPRRRTSSATHSKKLVAYINSLFHTNWMTCQKAEFTIQQASGDTLQLQHHVSSRTGFSFHLFQSDVGCHITPNSQSDNMKTKRSCNHHPLVSLLRRRRDYSHTSTILWLYRKDGRSAFKMPKTHNFCLCGSDQVY